MVSIRKTSARQRLLSALKNLEHSVPRVGMFAEDGEHSGAHMSYPELMAIHEVHGVKSKGGRIHRRVFEVTAMMHKREIMSGVESALKRQLMNGDTSPALTFNAFGQPLQKHVKETFGNAGLLPSNAAETISRKGANTPMVETSELKDHVQYKTTFRIKK